MSKIVITIIINVYFITRTKKKEIAVVIGTKPTGNQT